MHLIDKFTYCADSDTDKCFRCSAEVLNHDYCYCADRMYQRSLWNSLANSAKMSASHLAVIREGMKGNIVSSVKIQYEDLWDRDLLMTVL